jgi:hypothetical protein
LMEPIMKLTGPPLEFKTIVKFLNANSDEVMTSRVLIAAWPSAKGVPDVVAAIDFSSAEDAAKFAPKLNQFLTKVMPPTGGAEPVNTATESKVKSQTPKPAFYLAQHGTMLVLTPIKLSLNALRPEGKLLADNPNFRAAHTRFASETLFLFLDLSAIEREEEERKKQYAEQAKKQQEEAEKQAQDARQTSEVSIIPQPNVQNPGPEAPAPSPEPSSNEVSATDQVSNAMQAIGSNFFGGEEKWPDAVGVAVSFEGDSFDARALLINTAGEKSDAMPFMPMLVPGPSITPESPAIVPSDTQLFATFSLDWPQIYNRMTANRAPSASLTTHKQSEAETPFSVLEKRLQIKIKDNVLPLLGNEVAFSLPIQSLGFLPSLGPAPAAQTPQDNSAEQKPSGPGPFLLISIRDREGVKALLPKIVDGLGFKGASAFVQTEKREDTEISSFPGALAYAFIGNFLVISPDVETIRHVVDSYLKHETLAGEDQYRNYTRWQPRQIQGQFYIGPAFMENYRTWAQQPNSRLSDEMREFLARITVVAQPITYSLSNDGMGPFHELHIPKSLVVMAVTALAGETNPSPMMNNERMAMGAIYSIYSAEVSFHKDKGAGMYGSLEELLDQNLISKELLEGRGYKIDLLASGSKFEVTAVPVEYGKTGKLSFFIDETGIARAGDHGGAAATAADGPMD